MAVVGYLGLQDYRDEGHPHPGSDEDIDADPGGSGLTTQTKQRLAWIAPSVAFAVWIHATSDMPAQDGAGVWALYIGFLALLGAAATFGLFLVILLVGEFAELAVSASQFLLRLFMGDDDPAGRGRRYWDGQSRAESQNPPAGWRTAPPPGLASPQPQTSRLGRIAQIVVYVLVAGVVVIYAADLIGSFLGG